MKLRAFDPLFGFRFALPLCQRIIVSGSVKLAEDDIRTGLENYSVVKRGSSMSFLKDKEICVVKILGLIPSGVCSLLKAEFSIEKREITVPEVVETAHKCATEAQGNKEVLGLPHNTVGKTPKGLTSFLFSPSKILPPLNHPRVSRRSPQFVPSPRHGRSHLDQNKTLKTMNLSQHSRLEKSDTYITMTPVEYEENTMGQQLTRTVTIRLPTVNAEKAVSERRPICKQPQLLRKRYEEKLPLSPVPHLRADFQGHPQHSKRRTMSKKPTMLPGFLKPKSNKKEFFC